MWWVHAKTGSRQFAAPGSRVEALFAQSHAWKPENGERPDVQDDAGIDWEQVTNLGGGWYAAPDGEKRHGRDALIAYLEGKE